MKSKLAAALCLVLLSSTGVAATKTKSATPPAPPTCDRECLRGTVTQVMYGFVDHDTSKLPLAANLRVTEDGVEKTFDKAGLVRSMTKLRGYRQDIIDERANVALAGVMIEESGATVMLVVRTKVDAERKISELELMATRSRADGMIFNRRPSTRRRRR